MHLPLRRRRRPTSWVPFVALALLWGCAGQGPPVETSGNQFDQIQRNIFDVHCLGAGCHNAQEQAGGMNLSDGSSWPQLVNVMPQNPVAQAAGLLRVVPNDPATSFLLIKLNGPAPGEGSRMPLGMTPLSPTDIQAIQAWIEAGAPRGESTESSPTPTTLPTATDTPLPSATATVSPTPADTGTPTASVTGTPPSTNTPSATPSASPSPSPTPTPGMFDQIQTNIFNTTCTDAFCHDAQGMSGGLVLVAGQSYGNLVNVAPQNPVALNDGLLRVDPGHPENSFLLIKLTGPALGEGSMMPLLKDPLTSDQIQLITDWINAGAPQ